MKKALFLALLMTGCTPSCEKSTGVVTGKLIDVEWGGLVFNSCEIVVQYGDQSSNKDYSSSMDRSICDKAFSLLNRSVQINYKTYVFSGQRIDTIDLIQSITEAK